MKIVHVVPSIEEEASGPAYSVPSLSRALGNGDAVAACGLSCRKARYGAQPGYAASLCNSEPAENRILDTGPRVAPIGSPDAPVCNVERSARLGFIAIQKVRLCRPAFGLMS